MATTGKKSKIAVPDFEVIREDYQGSGKLRGKVALITGGDSGIGRSVAVHFAREGANVAIAYHKDDEDARETQRLIEAEGVKTLVFKGDLKREKFCQKIVDETAKKLGSLNILVNNAAMQFPKDAFENISQAQLELTFGTNIFPFFYATRQALQYLKTGDCVINTASVTAYRGSDHLVDYSSTKGAIVSFTRSLSLQLVEKGIRVNAVAPGPIWTPLIPATFSEEEVRDFGKQTPMKRAGQPSEVAPAYVFLACNDSSYVSGQTLHINGGEVVGG